MRIVISGIPIDVQKKNIKNMNIFSYFFNNYTSFLFFSQ